MNSSTPSRHSAFTLVEILAVVAIIGVLAAIIIPVIGRMRASAKSAHCLSNLRQMGPAFATFAVDHRNRYPLSYKEGSGEPDNNWYYHIAPYLGVPPINNWPALAQACAPGGPLGCPSNDINANRAAPWMSYKMTAAHRVWLDNKGGVANGGLLVTSIANPSQSLLVAEGWTHVEFVTWNPALADPAWTLTYPHRDKLNALFADGHVGSFSKEQMQEKWGIWYTRAIDG